MDVTSSQNLTVELTVDDTGLPFPRNEILLATTSSEPQFSRISTTQPTTPDRTQIDGIVLLGAACGTEGNPSASRPLWARTVMPIWRECRAGLGVVLARCSVRRDKGAGAAS
jgi:hypothetical protein